MIRQSDNGVIATKGHMQQDHLFSLYLPWSSEPLLETMIDGTLWTMIQATCLAWGMVGVALIMQFWSTYRLCTQGKKNES
jgi:hypothetical protein